MDEATQKVVDGTAWLEFCDLLAAAGAIVMAEGNPDDPLDRAEGFRICSDSCEAPWRERSSTASPAISPSWRTTAASVGWWPTTTLAYRTGSTPPATSAARSGCGGSARRWSMSCPTPAW